MGQYFLNQKLNDNFKTLYETINAHNYEFLTNSGVFSKDHVDLHTKELLMYLMDYKFESVLDLGCGYGVVGIVLAYEYDICVDMIDVNLKALSLAKHNCEINNVCCEVFESDGFENVCGTYDAIVLNPPIRAGKNTCYRLYKDSVDHLSDGGSLFIVIHKKHGAVSTIIFLNDCYSNVEILSKKKGLYVVKATK